MIENGLLRSRIVAVAMGLAAALSVTFPARAQGTLGARVNGLISVDVSDHYITPRGLNVEDQGVVAQPLTLLFWKLYADDKDALSEVTLTTGIWNSFHSRPSGAEPTRWNEIDPILGLAFRFKNHLKVDAVATSFYTPTGSYPTSSHLDLKLTYNDSWNERFSLNPYIENWVELNNKATVTFNPGKSKQGFYVTTGVTPSFNIGQAKLDIDTSANFVSSSFYQRFDGSDGGSGLAVFSTYPKISIPLKFMGVGYGAWSAYAGVTYFHLRNKGLLDGNQVLANPERQRNLARLRAGVSLFF